jgi:hypothetical protein
MSNSDEQATGGTGGDTAGTAGTAGSAGGTGGGEPTKKHGDPLLNEAEAANGPLDLPETGKGTSTSATA